MDIKKGRNSKEFLTTGIFSALVLFITGALVYLIYIFKLGLYGDSWYLIYDAYTQGSSFIHEIFSSDRPAIAYLFKFTYNLFGTHLPFYHLFVYFSRYMGALAFWVILKRIWVGNKRSNFLMVLFFLIYPGFLSQVDPVVFQTHVVNLSVGMISIALTIEAVRTQSIGKRVIFTIISIITGWFYLALLEYSIGLEILRFGLLGLFLWQRSTNEKKKLVVIFLKYGLPFVIIPLAFLVWRVFFFTSQRAATDVGIQLGTFFSTPVYTGSWWLIRYFFSTINVIFSAWIVPFYNIVGGLRLRDLILVTAGGILVSITVILSIYASNRKTYKPERDSRSGWIQQALLLGFLGVLAGILPIIVANRSILVVESRYALVAVPGVVMLLVAVLSLLHSLRVKLFLIGFLVFLSATAHLGNELNSVYQADSLRDFWWQVSWRVPQIKTGTTLIANYALMPTPENYYVWSPANLIYYPEKQYTNPIIIKLPAAIVSSEDINRILAHASDVTAIRRGNQVTIDYGNLLIMTQPASNSCVRVLDGTQPELSPLDDSSIKMIATYSNIGNIILTDRQKTPLLSIFGPEPAHSWCYYFQKAELARQMGDWQTVYLLGEEALNMGLSPIDRTEWFPYMQAYVALGQLDELTHYASVVGEDVYIRQQACQILTTTAQETHPEDEVALNFVDEKFCY